MERLIVLGTGNALVTKCYNTCFAIQRDDRTLLVDAGGGSGILCQLEKAGVSPASIHDMIVTHAHCDHILGVVWMVRQIGTLIRSGKYEGNFHIYGHAGLMEPILAMTKYTLESKFTSLFGDRILLHPVEDGETHRLMDTYDVRFFDILSTKIKQYGFSLTLENGKKLTCLGDEPFNPACTNVVSGSGWLLSEAFCLYDDREKFKPYEKHHSTVKDACELASRLGVENLVLWHTEDKNYDRRKELYTAEGKQYYSGNLFVPYDLEVIPLN